MTPIPEEYADLVVIPAVLHIDPLRFQEYPEALRAKIRILLQHWISHGQGMNIEVIQAHG